MKDYIIKQIIKIINVKEDQVKVEIPPKDSMGDYSIQCSNLINEEYTNPIEIANIIKEKFNDTDSNFSDIKIMDPLVIFFKIKKIN